MPTADPTLAASNTTPPNRRVMAMARRRLFFETFAFITGREVTAAPGFCPEKKIWNKITVWNVLANPLKCGTKKVNAISKSFPGRE